jgi:putative ABC transport system permease protein
MRLLIRDHLSNAYESLRSNRTRTFLTCLGVSIGVASITTVLALSNGATGIVKKQIDALEGNIAVIRPAVKASQDVTAQQNFSVSTLSEKDYQEIKKLPSVKTVVPLMIINGTAAKNSVRPTDTSVVASTPDLEHIANLTMGSGQFLDSATNQQTAVIGQQLSIDLFGTELSIGKTFTVRGQTFTVIGVLKRLNDPINFNTVDFDRTAIIHLAAGKQLMNGSTTLQQINIQARDPQSLPKAMDDVSAALNKLHGGDNDFTLLSGSEIAAPTNRLFSLIQGMTVAMAIIALVVGGIGIMNIMLVNVAERTREIGLRKAIGASNGHIIWQFLIESLIISIVGGFGGYVLGYVCAFAISSFLTFDPAISWQIAAVSFALSVGVGIIFGIYPAIKAARKDPIESLRQYH